MEKPSISGHLLESASWSEQETSNVARMAEFIQLIMNDHDFDTVRERFRTYGVQHSRAIPDGLEGLLDYVERFAKTYPEFSYDVKKIIADGDYVVFHSHATVKYAHRGNDKKGLNIIDTWRFEDGEIAEHWDAIQALDFSMRVYALAAGGKIKNANGVF